MQANIFSNFRCSICLRTVKNNETFFKSGNCKHKFCQNCVEKPNRKPDIDLFKCECISLKIENMKREGDLYSELENACDEIKLQKCVDHENNKKNSLCLDGSCKKKKEFCCMQCYAINHSKCNLKNAFSVERLFKNIKLEIGNSKNQLDNLNEIAENNDFRMEGLESLEDAIKTQEEMLINLNYESFQTINSGLIFFIETDFVNVSSTILSKLEQMLKEAILMCKNFVPKIEVNQILQEMGQQTGCKLKLSQCPCEHKIREVDLKVIEKSLKLTCNCCLCDENPRKRVNLIKNLGLKIREKMDSMIGPSPEYVIAFDKEYDIELREVTKWNNELKFLKENDLNRKHELENLIQRMLIREKNEATLVQREDIMNQKLMVLEKTDSFKTAELAKLAKKVDLMQGELAKMAHEKMMVNNQLQTLTQLVGGLTHEKTRMRSDLTSLTDDLFKVNQQKKLMNDVVRDINKLVESCAISNKELKSDVLKLKKSIRFLNPNFTFLPDEKNEEKMRNLFENSCFLNENHFSFFNEILPNFLDGNLIYNSKRNGEEASKFHERCDFKGATLVVIKSGQFIAGGFTDQSWESSDTLKSSELAFLFSFNQGRKYDIKKNQIQYAIGCFKDKGPTFGGSNDLMVCGKPSSNGNVSILGGTFDANGVVYPAAEMFGAKSFWIDEFEVFQVKLK